MAVSNLNFTLLLLLAVAVVVGHEWSMAFSKPQVVAASAQVTAISSAERQQFLTEMAAAIDLVNTSVQEQRQFALDCQQRLMRGEALELTDLQWLNRVAQHLGLPPLPEVAAEPWWQELLLRVDVVPRELLLAQAILYSGWGNSEEAKRSNRYFHPACAPTQCREDELKEPFISKEAAVAAQLQAVNSHTNYQLLRQLRAQLRRAQGQLDADELLPGLLPVAWRGNAELIQLRQLMRELRLLVPPPIIAVSLQAAQ